MKTAISIPDPIFAKAEKAARKLGISRSEFFTRAVEKMMASLRDAEVRASYDAGFAAGEAPAEARFRRRTTRRTLAAIEWNDE
ncbi:MAG: CopG family transcriptional regulator [Deltaproteobacteria bacterium]|nr:CopG family transcriptional regulator [Deltaproteobacteria bacterium]